MSSTADSFKSSVFFPRPRNATDPSPMNQCIDSNLPVFARDTGSGALKTYFACGYEHFALNMYKNGQERYRNVYELLQLDKPTKIYLDFDHGNVDDHVEFTRSTNAFIKHVHGLIPNDVPMYILDATTEVKLSLHVIFECFLADIPTVKDFVEHALGGCPCPYVDGKVYTRNRLFRVLYSRKFGKPMESSLKVKGTPVDAPYNAMDIFKTMIQAMIPPHYFGPFTAIQDELATNTTFIKLNNGGGGGGGGNYANGYSGSSCHCTVPDGFASLIESMGGGTLLSQKENDSFISCIVGGKPCPWKQDCHKNNNQYFTISKTTMRGSFQCADQECHDTPYDHVDVSFLWRKDLLSS